MAACGLLLDVEDNRVVSVRGDQEHPLTRGYFCVKGLASADWQNGEDRLSEALKKTDEAGFAAIETDLALDEIAAGLLRILERHGPRAIALYYGTGEKMNLLGTMALKGWLRAIGSPYLYSNSTVDQSAKWVTAGRMGTFLSGKHMLQDCDVCLVAGSNPAVSHHGSPAFALPSQNGMRLIREARKRGVQVIAIDPRRTEFARHADIHLQVIPGEDVALLAGMIHVIFRDELADMDFCERFVAHVAELRQAVADFPPHYAAARAGVPVDALERAARVFATAPRARAGCGTGLTMSPHSNLADHLVECLNAICGHYPRAGDEVRNPGAFFARETCAEGVRGPSRVWEEGPHLWTESSGVVGGGEYPVSRLPNEILEGGVRALVVVGGNPATALGQPDKTHAALGALELLITLDSRLSETAQLSHYVLPTRLPYERYDATHLFDSFFPEAFAQVAAPVCQAPPGVRGDWEVFWELARRMGRPLKLAASTYGGAPGGSPELALDMVVQPDELSLIRWACDRGAVSFDDLIRHPEGVKAQAATLIVEAADHDDGARLDVCPPDVAAEIWAVRAERDTSMRPYRLVVRRMLDTMNTAFRNTTRARNRWPEPPVFMNPADMTHEGIVEDAAVEITSDEGQIHGRAQADPNLRPGVVSMPYAWGAVDLQQDPHGAAAGFGGRLVSLDRNLESINFMPRQSAIPVTVRPRAL